jgi:hypothetical protein
MKSMKNMKVIHFRTMYYGFLIIKEQAGLAAVLRAVW